MTPCAGWRIVFRQKRQAGLVIVLSFERGRTLVAPALLAVTLPGVAAPTLSWRHIRST